MLPNLPKLQADIAQVFHIELKNRVNAYLGIVGDVPKSIIKEGKNPVTIRQDSSRDETNLKLSSAEISIKVEEAPYLTVVQRIEKLDTVAREMAKQISSHAFEKINETVEKVGNVVNAKGKPFSADAFFEVLEKMQIDFEPNGIKHKELTIVIPPSLNDKVKEIMEKIHQDPELRKRHEDIINKKRDEWHVREAARKLVG